jgi:hypothetical protein
MTTSRPLSQRAYESAVRMWQTDSRIARPKPEDYAHLDVAPPSAPASPAPEPPAVAAPAAVADALARMQAEARIKFAEPGQ